MLSPGLVALSSAVNWSRLATGLPLTASMASPRCSLPTDGPGSLTVLHRHRRRVLQVAQRRVLCAVLGAFEVGVVGLVDLVLRLVGRIDQVARNQLLAARHPQGQRLPEGQVVALRHRGHVQMPRRRMDLGALDVDDLLAVDLAERVERRAGTQRHIRHRHQRQQHPERHDRHHGDQQRQNPPVHGDHSKGSPCVGRLREPTEVH